MALNAWEVLSRNQALAEVLNKNLDVSEYLMSVYGQLPSILKEVGADPRDLRLRLSIDSRNRMTVHVSIVPGKYAEPKNLDPKILYAKNAVIVSILENNQEAVDLARKVVSALESWGRDKKIPFEDIRVSETMLARGGKEFVSLVHEKFYVSTLEEEVEGYRTVEVTPSEG